jgi:hypothetical protein
MNNAYHEAITKMENAGVDPEYINGWASGFLQNPKREEQRITDAYEAGFQDGEEQKADNFSGWVK